jgi:hypothetical protein
MRLLLYIAILFIGSMSGVAYTKLQRPTSEVLALVEGAKINADVIAFCVIGQHGNLAPYFNNDQLGHLAGVLKPKEDQNAVIMIFDGEVRTLKFTTFKYPFANPGCKSQ